MNAILNNLPGLFYLFDPTGKFLLWNKNLERITGYSHAEIADMNSLQIFVPEDRSRILERTHEMFSKGVASIEARLVSKDGIAVPWYFTGRSIQMEGQSCLMCTGVEISALKQTEAALQKRTEELTALNALGRNVISTLSLEQTCTAGLESIFCIIKPSMAFLFLRDGDRLILKEILPTSERRRMDKIPEHRVGECMCGLAVKEGSPFFSQDILDDPRCTWQDCKQIGIRSFAALPLRTSGEIIGVLGLASNIPRDFEQEADFLETVAAQIAIVIVNARLFEAVQQELAERRRIESSLRREREKFQVLLQCAPFGMAVIDEGGRFTYVNSMFTRIFGYDLNDVPDGRTWFRLAYPDPQYRKQVIHDWIYDLKTHQLGEKRPRIFDVICKDGSKKTINFIPVMLESGENLVAFEDITERLLLEDQLQHAQRMEAVGILAGGIAHDFNNLLQAISGYTQILLFNRPSDDADTFRLKAIEKSIARAAQLVRQLLLFSRKVESERRCIDLACEAAQSVQMLKRAISKMIDIELRHDSGLWKVKADPVQIEQSLLNLGINAADAMPDGGKLVIQTRNVIASEDAALQHANEVPGNYVLLSVSDSGCGMDAQTVKHIFEPFFTTKEVGKGTGLGLASVYGIVKSHGGHILCDSVPGKGTTFSIYLPAITGTGESTVSVLAAPSLKAENGTETILVVDDISDIRELTVDMLRPFGYTVLTAASGEEALQIYAAQKDAIALIILDMGMPGMGGSCCMQKLMEINPAARILIASGYSNDGPVQIALNSGAAGFIGKPYQLSEFLSRVRTILDGKNNQCSFEAE
jgi:PAS domain S-box-containing protein